MENNRRARREYTAYGPRLVDVMLDHLEALGFTGEDVHKIYGVGITWYSDVRSGRVASPSVDTVQRIYEDITKRPLVKQSGPRAPK